MLKCGRFWPWKHHWATSLEGVNLTDRGLYMPYWKCITKVSITPFTVTLSSIKYYFYLLCRLAINLSHCCYEKKMQMRVPAKGPSSYLYVPFLGKGLQALSNLTLRTYLCKIWTLVPQWAVASDRVIIKPRPVSLNPIQKTSSLLRNEYFCSKYLVLS